MNDSGSSRWPGMMLICRCTIHSNHPDLNHPDLSLPSILLDMTEVAVVCQISFKDITVDCNFEAIMYALNC